MKGFLKDIFLKFGFQYKIGLDLKRTPVGHISDIHFERIMCVNSSYERRMQKNLVIGSSGRNIISTYPYLQSSQQRKAETSVSMGITSLTVRLVVVQPQMYTYLSTQNP